VRFPDRKQLGAGEPFRRDPSAMVQARQLIRRIKFFLNQNDFFSSPICSRPFVTPALVGVDTAFLFIDWRFCSAFPLSKRVQLFMSREDAVTLVDELAIRFIPFGRPPCPPSPLMRMAYSKC